MPSILDKILNKTSEATGISQEIVDKIIGHKWKSVHESTYTCGSVEDSGLGKFTLRPRRIINKLIRLERSIEETKKALQDEGLDEKKTLTLNKKLQSYEDEKAFLKAKQQCD